MPALQLRLADAASGAEDVYPDVQIGAGRAVVSRAAKDGRVEPGTLDLGVTTEVFLGRATKPISAGRHRAELKAGNRVVLNGVLTNEHLSHGRSYGGATSTAALRRWAMTLRDTALDEAAALLEGVRLRDLSLLPLALFVDLADQNGATVGGRVYPLKGVVEAAAAAVGVSLQLPDPFALSVGYLDAGETATHPLVPTVVFSAPLAAADDEVPDWTAWQLLEAWAESEPLLLSAAYDEYPLRTITLSAVPVGRYDPAAFPEPLRPSVDSVVEDFDWTTETGAVDGETLDDFAVFYRDPVADRRHYAGRRWAIKEVTEGSDTSVVVENAQRLELPWRLAALNETTRTVIVGTYEEDQDVGRVPFVTASGGGSDDDVVLASLVDVSGTLRALGDRRPAAPAPGTPSSLHELGAETLFPRHLLRMGDAEVVRFTVPASAIPRAADGAPDIALMDPTRGLQFEGADWAVRAIEEELDLESLDVELVRPTTATAARPGTALQLDPAFTVCEGYAETFDTPTGRRERWYVRAAWQLPPESATPLRFEVASNVAGVAEKAVVGERDGRLFAFGPGAFPPVPSVTISVRAIYPTSTSNLVTCEVGSFPMTYL